MKHAKFCSGILYLTLFPITFFIEFFFQRSWLQAIKLRSWESIYVSLSIYNQFSPVVTTFSFSCILSCAAHITHSIKPSKLQVKWSFLGTLDIVLNFNQILCFSCFNGSTIQSWDLSWLKHNNKYFCYYLLGATLNNCSNPPSYYIMSMVYEL